jgi:hypothetical protein
MREKDGKGNSTETGGREGALRLKKEHSVVTKESMENRAPRLSKGTMRVAGQHWLSARGQEGLCQ